MSVTVNASSSSSKGKSAIFVLERETKGAVRYQEVDEQGNGLHMMDAKALVGTLYLRKVATFGLRPIARRVRITVETLED